MNIPTSRQRAVEEARWRREAEWDTFRARQKKARIHGAITLADRRAAETLLEMHSLEMGGGRRSRRSHRRSRRSHRRSRRSRSRPQLVAK